ncbi:uncharacterized protein LOC125238748 isoform X1 [Leguminivora glycinivorella]|uniref:uncharacterized protein LOC125238748 isoform X1 n=1 Tax=Leguminivora glycinivorella TaxID=1035111 RepID=UPI002010023D|nr:uncharacterized protein LOC125238748 isoform X1 [Leguminivora glycinivorella]
MLTLFIIITLTNFKIISGNDNNDTQFINSLPEKEKQEFLQKVEKRIQNEVPEVKTPELTDTNHTTVEVYEKRLEDQGKSIQSILRSEIDNLKSHHRRSSNDTTARIENQPHVDLTLRSRDDKSEATRRKNEESNSSESDTHNKEITETKPHLVPVYNYDPENAYYNNQKILKGKVEPQSIVEIKETHSTSTNLDVYSTDNGKSLRYKDVKERIILNNKIKQSSDLEDVILSDISDESSGDTAFIEKPLKHTLKKIRTKLYNKKLNDKSLHDVLGKDIITITEENGDEGDNGIDTNKSEKKTITELFTNFGAVLQNLVDKANDNEAPTPKNNSKDDKSDSDKETYEDIANSLEIHNKRLKNKGIQRLVNLVKDLKANSKELK